ncbi:hypothetical protein CAPTEDRAFT_218680 [Capitella teleta]|uniref:Uncharacterized protein n=1 Tax=Capitella teleta TaxID=283909 RepID=R7VLD4_CAPTE|nr:hypothetical protein CAPTEDRAFT_218680 [Capitella teleta]|eukprot:ELU18156.1 hypothetical protein CAPTEDRAFT_218680 [Capitella teleta]
MASMMKHQLKACRKHVNKFVAFVQKNSNMPFTFKYKGEQAVHGCNEDAARRSDNDPQLCLPDRIWHPAAQEHNTETTGSSFFRKFRQKSAGDEPLAQALNLIQREGMEKCLTDAAETVEDPELASLENIRRQGRQKAADGATRYQTYLQMNPGLSPLNIRKHGGVCSRQQNSCSHQIPSILSSSDA